MKAMEEKSGKSSKLHSSVQKLIRMIFDIESMKKAMLEFEVCNSNNWYAKINIQSSFEMTRLKKNGLLNGGRFQQSLISPLSYDGVNDVQVNFSYPKCLQI